MQRANEPTTPARPTTHVEPWPCTQDIDFLAIITEVDYEVSRRDIARGMRVRVAFLDRMVAQRRREIDQLGIREQIEDRFALPYRNSPHDQETTHHDYAHD